MLAKFKTDGSHQIGLGELLAGLAVSGNDERPVHAWKLWRMQGVMICCSCQLASECSHHQKQKKMKEKKKGREEEGEEEEEKEGLKFIHLDF